MRVDVRQRIGVVSVSGGWASASVQPIQCTYIVNVTVIFLARFQILHFIEVNFTCLAIVVERVRLVDFG